MRLSMFVLLCILLGPASAQRSAAAELPTVDVLRASIKAAAGTLPESRYERIDFTSYGVGGTQTIVHAGTDFRETDGDGGLQTARGRYHEQVWHQNANGQTVIEQPDPGNAVADAMTTTIARVSAPVDAYVIARLGAAGNGTKEFVDPRTYRIVRVEYLAPTQTTTYVYDDFRTVAGYTTAWHWTRRDGHPENDGDYRVEAFEARPIATGEIDIAPPRRELVQFPAGKTRVELPVQMLHDKFVVRVTIAGRGLDLELDSGAAGITLEENVAKQLGLRAVTRFSNAVNAGRINETSVIVPEMRVGDLRMENVAIRTIPLIHEEDAGVAVVGLLGFDFIAELGLKLDYEHGRVTAVKLTEPLNVSDPGTIALDIRVGDEIPLTDVTINGALGERFAVDTGAAGALMITDYFARRYPKALVDRGGGGLNRNLRLTGVGGPIDIRPYQLESVKLGSVTFRDFVAYRVMERKSYALDSDGFIGATVLKYFTVWLDYGDSRIYLVPNDNARAAKN